MKYHPSFFISGIVFLSLRSLIADPSPVPVPTASPASAATPQVMTPVSMPSPSAEPTFSPQPGATSTPIPSDKKNTAQSASKITTKQQPGIIVPEVLKKAGTEPMSIIVSLSKQRVYLLVGGVVAVDSPISSGKKSGWTPTGEFVILEKDPKHQSNLYGDFMDDKGKIVKKGVSSKQATPSGSHFSGASMKYFMRLTPEGVGMHAGILPGHPASHGCIRLPLEMAKIIYTTVSLNTPVSVSE